MTLYKERSGLRPTLLVSAVGCTIALSIMGDSLLYSILPLAAEGLGLTLPMVGVLLSVNRLVRIASNLWGSAIFEKLGPRRPFVAAAVMGATSTALYGAGLGFMPFVGARMLWGVAWSAFRQGGYQAVWTGQSAVKGRLTGLLWGLVRLGSATGVLLGGILYDRIGYRPTIAVFAVIALLAVPAALWIRWPNDGRSLPSDAVPPDPEPLVRRWVWAWSEALAEPVRRWLAAASFQEYMLSGIVI
jgi:predicted MFS family arabinose efflux permease